MISPFMILIMGFAGIGTFLFGFDTGIATTTIAHESWKDYMKNPNDGMMGAVVSVYARDSNALFVSAHPIVSPSELPLTTAVQIAGEAIGSVLQTTLGDRMGRIRFMMVMSAVVTAGSVIQTAAANYAMFLAGRCIAGVAVGGMVGTVPTYLSEITPPQHRGLIGGTAGAGISTGTMAANWVGLAASYAPRGRAQWRVPLGLQIPWGVMVLCGLATFMPESPRHLVRVGKPDEAFREFVKTRRGQAHDLLADEFTEMHAQILLDKDRETIGLAQAWCLYRRRIMVCIASQVMTSLTGVNVIQYFQTRLYQSLDQGPSMILVLSGVYGTVTLAANLISITWLLDRWGRRPMLVCGLCCLVISEIYAAVMQHFFQDSSNSLGKGFGILGIYLFALSYYGLLNSTTWLYGVEVLPVALRSKVMGIACALHFMLNVAVTQAAPTALSSIGENYYYVFVGCTTLFAIVDWFFFAETKNKTLEEIAGAFGDTHVSSQQPVADVKEEIQPELVERVSDV